MGQRRKGGIIAFRLTAVSSLILALNLFGNIGIQNLNLQLPLYNRITSLLFIPSFSFCNSLRNTLGIPAIFPFSGELSFYKSVSVFSFCSLFCNGKF
ncbi:hypothetical protein HanIR_Chr16g0790861 [Helianthus annuus]|nr:hypothetical protein HanIR_Chr16g0790861 [Helianthus annuus]